MQDTPKTQSTEPLKTGGELVRSDQVLPPNVLVVPIDSNVVFPTMMAPVTISDEKSIATIEEAMGRQKLVGLMLVKQGTELYRVGVLVRILKRLKMPDGSSNILVHALKRFRVKQVISQKPYIVAEPEYMDDVLEKSLELDAHVRAVIVEVKRLSEVNPFFTDEMKLAMLNAPNSGVVADLVAFSLSLPKDAAQDFLETVAVRERFEKLIVYLKREQDLANLQKKITDDVNDRLSQMQREYFLKEQLKAIKKELSSEGGVSGKAGKSQREQIEAKGMPDEVKKIALAELDKFETIPDSSPEHHLIRNYIEALIQLPWSERTEDLLDLKRAARTLHEDHFGLEKVKDRILEFLAVRKRLSTVGAAKKKKANPKIGSILCLVGPPGVGKTSMGRSVARALGRNFYRFSLGGMRDEAEIKGHRRTYVGAMPGKVMQAIRRAGSLNPVIMLDEIDKLGVSFQGDPASALLEVLDPEQNAQFLDHYLDVPFDLSQVLFIATANQAATIPAPLLDRMEVIELSGYTLEEKERIATRYVVPKILETHGLTPKLLRIESDALKHIMLDYAREPGLRTLQQMVEAIARKAARQIVSGVEKGKRPKAIVVKAKDLKTWLGPKRFFNEVAERTTSPGVVVGLAWTALGGDILFVEASDAPGTGGLKLTGQMGDVMTESATLAFSFVKKQVAREKQLKADYFKDKEFHIHLPAGAIPKDGPSAGAAMATAVYSLMTGRKLKPKLAMTGELSLTGKVLPVGGIKEKLLAAKRAGIHEVLLPRLNRPQYEELSAVVRKGIKTRFVDRLDDVLKVALEPEHRSHYLK